VRKRARANSIPCTITDSDLPVPTHCPVFGTLLDLYATGHRDNWPSVDRMDPRKGYTPGNVAIISFRANRLKSNMRSAEVRQLVTYMEDHGDTVR
jgi:hypothetical protein